MKRLHPLEWINEVKRLVNESNLLSTTLENGILNDCFFTEKQTVRFEIWQNQVKQMATSTPNFFTFLDGQTIEKAKENHSMLNYELLQLEAFARSILKRECFKLESKRHHFTIRNFRDLNRLISGLLMNVKFETQNFYQLHLNPEIDGLDGIGSLKKLEALTPHSIEQIQHKKGKKESPKAFEELFYNLELMTPCIELLKELDPPLIDIDNNYIGKSKGAICVWIKELERQGILKHFSDRKIFASLIPQQIGQFTIDESMFGKNHPRAEDNYKTDIKTLISQIKLSQDSQKGKMGK